MRAAVVVLLAALPLSSCQCGAPPPPPAGNVCGNGTVDGQPYAVDAAKTRLVLVVKRNDGAGCNVFHNHVGNATIAKLEYVVGADPKTSTFKVTARADGLDPDDADLRDEFLTKQG